MIFANSKTLFFLKLNLILILLLLPTMLELVYAQNGLELQLDFANKLYNEEKFFDAITEYKRLQFFDSTNQYAFITNKNIGMCYKYGGKFDDAINFLTLAELEASNLDSIFKIKIEIIKVNLLRGTIYRALELMNLLSEEKRFLPMEQEISYWKGWAFIFNEDWKNAAVQFNNYEETKELGKLCENVESEQYSSNFAKAISYIFPGAGQFYTQNYLSGILSLGWITFFTYLGIQAFNTDRVFDGLMILNFLDFRFYRGNIQNAERFALETNQNISNWMLNYLQFNYHGPKP